MAMKSAVLRPPPQPRLGNTTGAGAYVEERGIKDEATVTPIFRASRMPTSDAERQLRDMYEQSSAEALRQATEGAVLAASGGLGHYSNMAYEQYLKQITPPGYTRQVKTEGTLLSDTVDHDERPITLEVERRVDHRFILREAGRSYDPSARGPNGKLNPELMVSNSRYAIPVGPPRIVRDHKEPTTVASFKGVTWVGYTHTESPGAWERARGRALRAEAKRDRTRKRLGRRRSTFLDFACGKGVLRRPPDVAWLCRNPDGKSQFFDDEWSYPNGHMAPCTYEDALYGKIERLKVQAIEQFKSSPFIYEPVITHSVTGTRSRELKRQLHPDLKAQLDAIELEVLTNEAGGDLPWDYTEATGPALPSAQPSQDEGRSSTDSPSWEVDEDLVSKAVSLGIIDWDQVPNPYEVSDQFIQDWAAGIDFRVRSKQYADGVRGAGVERTALSKAVQECSVGTESPVAGTTDRREATEKPSNDDVFDDPVQEQRIRDLIVVPSCITVEGQRKVTVVAEVARNSIYRIRGRALLAAPDAGEDVIDLPPSEYRVIDQEAEEEEPTEAEIRKALLGGSLYSQVKNGMLRLRAAEARVKLGLYRPYHFSYLPSDPTQDTLRRLVDQHAGRHAIRMYARGYRKSTDSETPWYVLTMHSGPYNPLAPKPSPTRGEEIERVLTMDVTKAMGNLFRRAREMFSNNLGKFNHLEALRMRRQYGIVPDRGYLRMLEKFRTEHPHIEVHSRFPLRPHKPVMRTQYEVATVRYSGTGVARKTGTKRQPTSILDVTDEAAEHRQLELMTPIAAPPDWVLRMENAKLAHAMVANRSLALRQHLDPVELQRHADMVMPYITTIQPTMDPTPSKGRAIVGPNGQPIL
jgi:hypothetical protein